MRSKVACVSCVVVGKQNKHFPITETVLGGSDRRRMLSAYRFLAGPMPKNALVVRSMHDARLHKEGNCCSAPRRKTHLNTTYTMCCGKEHSMCPHSVCSFGQTFGATFSPLRVQPPPTPHFPPPEANRLSKRRCQHPSFLLFWNGCQLSPFP